MLDEKAFNEVTFGRYVVNIRHGLRYIDVEISSNDGQVTVSILCVEQRNHRLIGPRITTGILFEEPEVSMSLQSIEPVVMDRYTIPEPNFGNEYNQYSSSPSKNQYAEWRRNSKVIRK